MKLLILILLVLSTTPALLAADSGHSGHGSGSVSPVAVTNFIPFVDPLPIPVVAKPVGLSNGLPIYDMSMVQLMHRFHRDLPEVPVWGYAGSYPGPTLVAIADQPIYVRWINQLPKEYPAWLPPSTNNHGVHGNLVQNVVHLHGGANRPEFDGHPAAWFRPGEERTYYYDNTDLSGDHETLWYHDHAIGVTANNVYAGLTGFYLLRNPAVEDPLGLPSGPYDIPLAFQDRDLQTNTSPATLLATGVPPWHHLPVVNGKIAPYLEVEPRKYRFRILNGCGFRTLGLALLKDGQSFPMDQIATEDGFLAAPFRLALTNPGVSTLRMMPGERAEVVIDFAGLTNGSRLVVTNSFDDDSMALPPFEPLNVVGGTFLQFRVQQKDPSPDPSRLPAVLSTNLVVASELAKMAVRTRTITLDLAVETPFPGLIFSRETNLFASLNMRRFMDPVTETPRAGDVEIWEFVNLSPEAHPMHVHLLDFLILDRTPLGTNPPAGASNYITDRLLGRLKPLSSYLSGAKARPAQPNEIGPKDVVRCGPQAVTRIVMQWPTQPQFRGPYVYHCHILDHEDNDMMRPIEVLDPLLPGQISIAIDGLTGLPEIQFGTASGITYILNRGEDLGALTPQPGTGFLGTGMTQYLPEGPSAIPWRFYRVTTP